MYLTAPVASAAAVSASALPAPLRSCSWRQSPTVIRADLFTEAMTPASPPRRGLVREDTPCGRPRGLIKGGDVPLGHAVASSEAARNSILFSRPTRPRPRRRRSRGRPPPAVVPGLAQSSSPPLPLTSCSLSVRINIPNGRLARKRPRNRRTPPLPRGLDCSGGPVLPPPVTYPTGARSHVGRAIVLRDCPMASSTATALTFPSPFRDLISSDVLTRPSRAGRSPLRPNGLFCGGSPCSPIRHGHVRSNTSPQLFRAAMSAGDTSAAAAPAPAPSSLVHPRGNVHTGDVFRGRPVASFGETAPTRAPPPAVSSALACPRSSRRCGGRLPPHL